jgi:cytoskeleton protein RodZ
MYVCDRLMTTEQNTDTLEGDLKTARESLGLTLKDLFERTRISVVNLEAIEKNDFHLLPVPIYTRNFIKTYADALGVDGKPVLQRYEDFLQSLQVKARAQAVQQSEQAPLAMKLHRYKTFLWIACIVVVFAAVSFFVTLVNKTGEDEVLKTETAADTTAGQAAAQPVRDAGSLPPFGDVQDILSSRPIFDGKDRQAPAGAIPAAAQAPNPERTQAAVAEEEQSSLVIRAGEETWIRIQTDDKEPFQVLLKEGETVSYKAARFNIDVGNAGGIRLQLNGKNIDNLGRRGEVIHLRLP